MPYLSPAEIDKLTTTHKKNKELELELHGNKDFVPFCANRRVLDNTNINPALFETKYNDNKNMYREVNKEKWIDQSHDFKTAIHLNKKKW